MVDTVAPETPLMHEVPRPRPEPALVSALAGISGLASAVSDVLDELGIRGAVPASEAPPLEAGSRVIGVALTLRYLPERQTAARLQAEGSNGHLGNTALARAATTGDIAVIDGGGMPTESLLGGIAAADAKSAGVSGVLIDGAVRDVDEIVALGLPVWAAARTQITGRRRMMAVELNGWVSFRGVQVRPGDVVIADDNGICFVPPELFPDVVARVLDTAG
jgi:regulator of RNase E activity RraA